MSHNTDFKTLQLDLKDGKLIVFYRVNMQSQAGITGYAWFYVAVTSYSPSLEFRLFKLIILGGPPPVFQYRTRAVKLFVQMGNSKMLGKSKFTANLDHPRAVSLCILSRFLGRFWPLPLLLSIFGPEFSTIWLFPCFISLFSFFPVIFHIPHSHSIILKPLNRTKTEQKSREH